MENLVGWGDFRADFEQLQCDHLQALQLQCRESTRLLFKCSLACTLHPHRQASKGKESLATARYRSMLSTGNDERSCTSASYISRHECTLVAFCCGRCDFLVVVNVKTWASCVSGVRRARKKRACVCCGVCRYLPQVPGISHTWNTNSIAHAS